MKFGIFNAIDNNKDLEVFQGGEETVPAGAVYDLRDGFQTGSVGVNRNGLQ